MKTSFAKTGIDKVKADSYIFLCFEDKASLEDKLKIIQRQLRTKIAEISFQDFKGKENQTALIYTSRYRIVLCGLGKKEKITLEKVRIACSKGMKRVKTLNIKRVAVDIVAVAANDS